MTIRERDISAGSTRKDVLISTGSKREAGYAGVRYTVQDNGSSLLAGSIRARFKGSRVRFLDAVNFEASNEGGDTVIEVELLKKSSVTMIIGGERPGILQFTYEE